MHFLLEIAFNAKIYIYTCLSIISFSSFLSFFLLLYFTPYLLILYNKKKKKIMPGPATIFTALGAVGAVGACGAAAYVTKNNNNQYLSKSESIYSSNQVSLTGYHEQ
jgi:hypothetical protein